MTTYIQPPNLTDSLSRVVLDGKEYLIRFTYNVKKDYWTFGLHEVDETVIISGIKIVPNFPLTCFCSYKNKDLPNGIFGCLTNKEHVRKDDFVNGDAIFCFIPKEDLEDD